MTGVAGRARGAKFMWAGAATLVLAIGAYGVTTLYPPEGPSAGTIGAAQQYVNKLDDVTIPKYGRYILVDAASARLYMMENGRVRDVMKVVVGKPASQTPALSSYLYAATVNPYWYVPTDLARTIIAPLVLKYGLGYLDYRGYEVLSTGDDNAEVLPAKSVDWKAVEAGTQKVWLRQKPGPDNSMGTIKFNLANSGQIYLHDTPHKEHFAEANRSLSNGCVRLEDAPRLARWIFGDDPEASIKTPEKKVPIPMGVPITIAYLGDGAQTQLASLN